MKATGGACRYYQWQNPADEPYPDCLLLDDLPPSARWHLKCHQVLTLPRKFHRQGALFRAMRHRHAIIVISTRPSVDGANIPANVEFDLIGINIAIGFLLPSWLR